MLDYSPQYPELSVANPSTMLKDAIHEGYNHEWEWIWVSEHVASAEEREYCLQRALYINPKSNQAHLLLEEIKVMRCNDLGRNKNFLNTNQLSAFMIAISMLVLIAFFVINIEIQARPKTPNEEVLDGINQRFMRLLVETEEEVHTHGQPILLLLYPRDTCAIQYCVQPQIIRDELQDLYGDSINFVVIPAATRPRIDDTTVTIPTNLSNN